MLRHQVIRFIGSLLLSISILGCQGLGDEAIDLGGGYVYRSDGGTRWINPAESIFASGIDGNVLSYNFDQSFIVVVQEPSREYYKNRFPDVIALKYSLFFDSVELSKSPNRYEKEFLRSFWWQDTILRHRMRAYIRPDYNYDLEKVGQAVDSVIRNNPYYKRIFSGALIYWIIRKNDHLLLGPYSKGEYIRKKSQLGVPKALVLEEGFE